jgi:predicted ferric reductase
MKKFRRVLILFALLIMIGQLVIIDYSDLSWSNNAGSYLGILSMILLIASMIYSIRYDQKAP